MKLRILFAGLIWGLAALAADTGSALFQRAVSQEREGKLDDAIKMYQSIAKQFASDRALAAEALIHAASCTDLQGQAKQDKAIELYNQVAREFKDQLQPAAKANARLAELRRAEHAAQTASMTSTQLKLPSVECCFFTDGQHAVYQDAITGDLMASDFNGKNKRLIFPKPKTGEYYAYPSRDLSMVEFALLAKDRTETHAVIKVDGTGRRDFATVGLAPHPAWSWDNRYLLYTPDQTDGSARLVEVSIKDGHTREVLRREHSTISTVAYSPDSRFIAFVEGKAGSSQVFVMPAQGGDPQLVSDDSTFLDWTKDGRYLAITTQQNGSTALKLLPMKDGHAAGPPVFISYGSYLDGQTTANGDLLYFSLPPRKVGAVSMAELDTDGHLSAWNQLNLAGTNNDPYPAWSPDSKHIAYNATNLDTSQPTFAVHLQEIPGGKDRELYRSVDEIICAWASQHPNLLCDQHPSSETTDILSISSDSGRVDHLGSFPGFVVVHEGIQDDKQLILARLRPTPSGTLRWDIATQQETLLEKGFARVSPDERWLLTLKTGESGLGIVIRPAAGGDWKRLVTLRIPPGPGGSPIPIVFTFDGKWVFYHDRDPDGNDGLYRVPTAGGEAQRLGNYPSKSNRGSLKISPDGRKILAVAPDVMNHVQAFLLENFEPIEPPAR